jgi:hypothetical protein
VRSRVVPRETRLLDDVAQARVRPGVDAFREGRPREGVQILAFTALRAREGPEAQAALDGPADGIADVAEGLADELGLALRVEQDVQTLRAWHGQAAHHHREHRSPHDLDGQPLGQREHAPQRDRSVGAAQRGEALEA